MSKILINGLYIFNIGLPAGIFFFLLISGKQTFAIQVNLLFSVVLFFTASLSSYHRQIFISENNISYCTNQILNRIKFFPFIFIFSLIISIYVLSIDNYFLICSIIILLFSIWLVEIFLSIDEILKKKFFFLQYLLNFFNGVCLLIFIFYIDQYYLPYFFTYLAVTYFYINVYDKKIIKKTNKHNVNKDYAGYISSVIVNLLLLTNKIIINHYFDSYTVSLVFLSFIIVSFFNTIVANSFGPYLFSNTIKTKQILFCIFLYLIIIILIYFYLILFKNNFSILNIIIISGISGISLFMGFVIRQRLLNSKNLRKRVAILDIIISVLSFAILLIILNYFKINIYYFILITTTTTFISYLILFKFSYLILKK
jgi:hypothetical protein